MHIFDCTGPCLPILRTSGENIGDSGIIQAYRAWKAQFNDSLKAGDEYLLPGLNHTRYDITDLVSCINSYGSAQGSTFLHCLRSYLGRKHQTGGFGSTGPDGSTFSQSISRRRDFA